MFIRLNSGVVGKGIEFLPGDVVDWKDDGDCARMIKSNIATQATKDEISTAAGKIRVYTPPKQRPEDKWPPNQLKKLPTENSA